VVLGPTDIEWAGIDQRLATGQGQWYAPLDQKSVRGVVKDSARLFPDGN
jgi:hypothetical protein